jgi:3-oxoacyl-[acyl-carrier-protein] synthase-1
VQGDVAEVNALRGVFGTRLPAFSSTKSMTGHAIGAAGAQEIIFCIGMMERGFLAPSINIETLDAEFAGLPIVRTPVSRAVNVTQSNSFGFGGTNASILLTRPVT